MNGTGGSLHFDATMTNDDLIRKMRENRQAIVDSANTAQAEGERINQWVRRAMIGVGGYFGVSAIKNFGQEVIRVFGDMQMIEASFEVLLGSKSKAQKMVSELRDFATESPLELTHVTSAAQTLMGFGIEAEKIVPIIKQIGDVSMGNSGRFQALSLAFAQCHATGKLMGQDLLQMINAGFNPLKIISEQTGRSIGDLKKDMAGGAISAEMVADAFRIATEEGGQFYGMTQKQAEGIVGLKASFQDAITTAMVEMGEKQEELIVGGYKLATSLVENYEKVGKILAVLIAGYGSYKAALIAVAAAQKAVTISGNINAWFELAKGIKTAKDAQVALNLAMGANPIVKIVSLIIAAGTALYLFSRNAKDAEKELTGLAKASENAGEEFDKESSKIKALQDIMNNSKVAYDERKRALNELKQIIPSYNAQLTEEGNLINNNTTAIKNYLEQLEKQIRLKTIEEELSTAIRIEMRQQREYDAAQAVYSRMSTNTAYNQKAIIDPLSWFGGTDIQKAKKAADEARARLNATRESIRELRGEIETRSSVSSGGSDIIKTFTEQLEESATRVKTLKSELKDLLAGKGTESDFAKAIENKTKELKAAEDNYNLLRGIDKSTIKASKDDIAEQQRSLEAYAKEQVKQANELARELTATERSRITDKIELIRFDRDQTIRAIEAERNAYIALSQAAERPIDTSVFDQRTAAVRLVASINIENELSILEADNKKLLEQYHTFAEKYKAIAIKLEKDKAIIRAAGGTEEQEAEAEFQAGKAIEMVDEEVVARSKEFKDFLDEIASMQLYYLEKKLASIRESFNTINATGTDEERAMLKQQIKALEEQIRTERSNLARSSKDPLQRWKNTEKVLHDVNSSLSDLGKNFTGVAGEAFQAATQMAAGTISMISGIAELANWAVRSTQMAAQGASAAIIAAEKASVILTIISAALQVINILTSKDNSKIASENAEAARRLSGYWESINYQVTQYMKLLEQAAGVDYFAMSKKTLDALNEGLERSKKAVTEFPKGKIDNLIEDQLRWLGEHPDISLETAPESVLKNGADSLAIWKLIKEGEIDSYRALKNNADLWSKIPDWMQKAVDQAISYAEQIDEVTEKLNEDLFQTTSQDIESVIKDWIKSGKDGIDDMGAYFEDTMRDALLQSFVIDQLRGRIKDWYNMYTSLADSDADGQLDLNADEIKRLRESWDDMIAWAKSETEGISQIVGSTTDLTASQKATAQGFQAMNQDTGNELNGRFTDLQGKMGDIREVAIDLRGLAIISVGHLSNIDKNTKHLSMISEGIEQIKKNTANL